MDALTRELSQPLLKLDKKHRYLLQWFFDHNGQTVPWSDLVDPEFRLANRAKGIYKPQGMEYALSIKQTLNSPYADRLPRPNEIGGWTYDYDQEASERTDSHLLPTNRELEMCMRDGVPVGVLIQATPKPNVTYNVWGLALIRNWQGGVFTLEGRYATKGEIIAIDDFLDRRARKVADEQEGLW